MPKYETYAAIRDKAGKKDADVARMSGVATATLSSWKKGTYTPKLDKLRAIAAVLDCTIDDLIEG